MLNEFEFILLALAVSGLAMFFGEQISEWSEDRRFQKEKAKFRAEVAKGIAPKKCPMRTTCRGSFVIDAEDLIETENFKKLLKTAPKPDSSPA